MRTLQPRRAMMLAAITARIEDMARKPKRIEVTGAVVLTRKVGEQILIEVEGGARFVVELRELRRTSARISVAAPGALILRGEHVAGYEEAEEEPESEGAKR